jgi:hypothetical protein
MKITKAWIYKYSHILSTLYDKLNRKNQANICFLFFFVIFFIFYSIINNYWYVSKKNVRHQGRPQNSK